MVGVTFQGQTIFGPFRNKPAQKNMPDLLAVS